MSLGLQNNCEQEEKKKKKKELESCPDNNEVSYIFSLCDLFVFLSKYDHPAVCYLLHDHQSIKLFFRGQHGKS